MHYWIAAKKT